jgi:hypothetical protein
MGSIDLPVPISYSRGVRILNAARCSGAHPKTVLRYERSRKNVFMLESVF